MYTKLGRGSPPGLGHQDGSLGKKVLNLISIKNNIYTWGTDIFAYNNKFIEPIILHDLMYTFYMSFDFGDYFPTIDCS